MTSSYDRFFIKKKAIMKSNDDFRRILSRGTSFKTQHFSLVVCRSHLMRVGFTVQRGIKLAVVRNRLKRRFRELWRLNHPSLKVPLDIIIISRRSAYRTSFDLLEVKFKSILDDINDFYYPVWMDGLFLLCLVCYQSFLFLSLDFIKSFFLPFYQGHAVFIHHVRNTLLMHLINTE